MFDSLSIELRLAQSLLRITGISGDEQRLYIFDRITYFIRGTRLGDFDMDQWDLVNRRCLLIHSQPQIFRPTQKELFNAFQRNLIMRKALTFLQKRLGGYIKSTRNVIFPLIYERTHHDQVNCDTKLIYKFTE